MIAKEVKQIVLDMELSADALLKADKLLESYGENDEVPEDVINKILLIVDVEIDANQLAADIYQSGAELADEFLKKVDDESNKINQEIDSVVK